MNHEERDKERDEEDRMKEEASGSPAGEAPEKETEGRDPAARQQEHTGGDKDEEEAPSHPDYVEQIIHILHSTMRRSAKVARLADYHENDLADALEHLTREERIDLYRLLDQEELSEVFSYLDDASPYLEELSVESAADILENMDADDAVDALEDLDENARSAIIEQMDDESKEDIRLIRSYDDDEIGSKMTTNYIAIRRGLTVKQAMRSVVEQASENDNLTTIYVLEDDDTFYGTMTLQELIIARKKTDLESLISTSYPYVYDHESVEKCIEELKDYSEDSIPVVDSEKKLLGVITSQDLVEVVDEEMGEDYAKLAGLTEEEDMKETLLQSMGKRIPWLLTLMVLGLVVSSVVGIFEQVVSQLTIVVAFQSLILGMSGNVGTQSLAVTIRVLTDENVSGRQKLGLVLKELRIGVCNGLMLGVMSFALVGLYIHFGRGYDLGFSYQVSGCLGVAMLLAMSISSLTGTVVPMFFHKIGVDPAVASGPLITTLNDMVAVISYYGLVMVLLIPALSA